MDHSGAADYLPLPKDIGISMDKITILHSKICLNKEGSICEMLPLGEIKTFSSADTERLKKAYEDFQARTGISFEPLPLPALP